MYRNNWENAWKLKNNDYLCTQIVKIHIIISDIILGYGIRCIDRRIAY